MTKLNFDLDSYLASKRYQINIALQELLENTKNPSRIINAMTYSVMAGGKRIRPVLCIAAAEAVGASSEAVMKAACALEMIHTYSLIHDDLPAMDNDDLRRGKPTCHIAFDEATSILAGDALLTLAFQILSSVDSEVQGHESRWLRVIRSIAQASGYQGMIGGQMMDITAEGLLMTLDDLKEMHALKTGALINVSVYSGAILGGANPTQIERLGCYANNIGLAFQVVDDILNVEGDPDVMGKAIGTDKARRKSTYPSLMGMKASKTFAKQLINTALQALDIFDKSSDPLRAVALYIIERKQ